MIVGKLEGDISILGIDFLEKYTGVVNLCNETLHLGKQIFPLSQNPKHLQTCARKKLSDTIKIHPTQNFVAKATFKVNLSLNVEL